MAARTLAAHVITVFLAKKSPFSLRMTIAWKHWCSTTPLVDPDGIAHQADFAPDGTHGADNFNPVHI